MSNLDLLAYVGPGGGPHVHFVHPLVGAMLLLALTLPVVIAAWAGLRQEREGPGSDRRSRELRQALGIGLFALALVPLLVENALRSTCSWSTCGVDGQTVASLAALFGTPVSIVALVGVAVTLVGVPTAIAAIHELFRPAPLEHLPASRRRFGLPDPAACSGPFGPRA